MDFLCTVKRPNGHFGSDGGSVNCHPAKQVAILEYAKTQEFLGESSATQEYMNS